MSRTHGDRSDSDNKIRLLKKQVDSLRREVRQLRKENNKLRELTGEEIDIEDVEPDFTERKTRKRGEGLLCEECGRGVMVASTFQLIGGEQKTYLTCNNASCKHRKATK